MGVGLKAVWYGAEAFGKLLSLGRKVGACTHSLPRIPALDHANPLATFCPVPRLPC